MSKNKTYFWRGIKHDIPLCCILFFDDAWDRIRKTNTEYGQTMHKLTNNEGVILCPNCLTKKFGDTSHFHHDYFF